MSRKPTGPGPVESGSAADGESTQTGPRGIEALQAEMAQGDVRLMARQIAEDQSGRDTPDVPVLGGASNLVERIERWRWYLVGVVALAVIILGVLPIVGEHRYRSEGAHLAATVQQVAKSVGSASGGDVAGWIRERDLPALKAFYGEQRARILEMLASAGFADLPDRAVSIRVDYDAATLVIGVQVESSDDRGWVVSADLGGRLVGRALPPAGFGPAFDEHGSQLITTSAVGGLLVAALWLIPIASRRRSG